MTFKKIRTTAAARTRTDTHIIIIIFAGLFALLTSSGLVTFSDTAEYAVAEAVVIIAVVCAGVVTAVVGTVVCAVVGAVVGTVAGAVVVTGTAAVGTVVCAGCPFSLCSFMLE